MNDPCRPFRQMARNAQLANRRLAQACLALAPGEWEAPRVSFFPSLKATLNHLLVVDRFYLDAIAGGSLGPDAWADPEPCATAADWAEAQAEIDRQLVVLAETLVAQDLLNIVQIRRSGRVQIETLGDTLLHLLLHDQHHRGQAHAMLSGSSVAPPQLDEFIVSDDAQHRRDDLAALGRDEDWLRR